MEIRVLRRRALGIRAIAKELGSRTTVKRYLRDQAASRYAPRSPRPTKLDSYKAYLRETHRRGEAALESGRGAARGDPGARLRRRKLPGNVLRPKMKAELRLSNARRICLSWP